MRFLEAESVFGNGSGHLYHNSAKGLVSRILFYAVIPLGGASPLALVSDLPGGSGNCFEPPCRIGPMRSRRLVRGPGFPPYLVLLRVGFTLPPTLLPERCALTAPFHPYPGSPRGGMFSVALAVHGPLRPRPGRYPAHCPAEFGLSSPEIAAQTATPAATARSSCHL